jgi:hypothetical protein
VTADRETLPSAEQQGSELAERPGVAGQLRPAEVSPEVRDELERLLGLVASLRELPLEGVEPAFDAPRWE